MYTTTTMMMDDFGGEKKQHDLTMTALYDSEE
jgi:hypothetical protein